MSKNIRLKSLLKENTDMLDKGKEYMFVEYHGKSLFPAAIIPVRYDGIDSRLKRHMFYPVEDKYKNKFPMGIAIPDTGGPVLNKKFKKDNNISWKITDRVQQEAEQQKLKEMEVGDNDKIILNFEKTKDDILKELPKITFDDFTPMELKVLTNHLQQSLYMMKKKRLPIGSMNEEFNYVKHEIEHFMSKSDQKSPYSPLIKFHWGGDNGEASTKWISVNWDSIAKIAELLSGNEV